MFCMYMGCLYDVNNKDPNTVTIEALVTVTFNFNMT